MENTENNGTFNYTYSAKQQEEVKSIRQRYIPREESKMDQLRNLDQSAKKPGKTISIIIGIISSLLLGSGMACIMEWPEGFFMVGLVLGLVGLLGMVLAYPLYTSITKSRRKKLAPQIIELSDELIN